MKKRMLSAIAVLLTAAMLCACVKTPENVIPTTEPEATPVETTPATSAPQPTQQETQEPEVPEETKEDTVRALNALLIGMNYQTNGSADVSQWTDAQIAGYMYSKLLRDSFFYSEDSYLRKINLESWWNEDRGDRFALEAIREFTRDALGREFPADTKSEYIWISGNEVGIEFAAGESTQVYVQDFLRQGQRIDAVGLAVYEYAGFREFAGYFHAIFEENPDSIYGYTLRFFNTIPANQTFGTLLAGASTVLVEGDTVHSAGRAVDGDLSTAWVESVPGVGIQEWIKLETADGSRMDVAAIGFDLGYHKSDKTLERNGWPTKILIETETGSQEEIFYEYTDVVVLEHPGSTGWIKITILDAEAGSKYEDTCISEIRLHGMDTGAFFLIDGQ